MNNEIRDDFACLILSHGRAHGVKTVKELIDCGYTGKYYVVIDNEDEQQEEYKKVFGEEHVVVFDKLKKSLECETCDIPRKRNAVIYARESCFEIARSLNLNYFLELDDDYDAFSSRIEKNGTLSQVYVKKMNAIINEMLDFLETSGATCIAFAQNGDFIGGLGSTMYRERVHRKIMNAFFCKTDRPFHFLGRMNDDVNTYLLEGSRGTLFMTVADCSLRQTVTQKTGGGLTEMYQENGTYVKSFFSVITNPSCVKVGEMGQFHKRMHHSVSWENAVPKIIREDWRKSGKENEKVDMQVQPKSTTQLSLF
jgi:hypothetical protein